MKILYFLSGILFKRLTGSGTCPAEKKKGLKQKTIYGIPRETVRKLPVVFPAGGGEHNKWYSAIQ